jgi:prophage DNA circulation protein
MASLMNPIALAMPLVALISSDSLKSGAGGSGGISALVGYSLPPVGDGGYTPPRQAQSENRVALQNLVTNTAVAIQITDLAKSDPPTLDDAREVTATIVALSDRILLNPSTRYATVDAILQLRTDAVQHFAESTRSLPRAVKVENKVNLPAIALAYEFYGDAWYLDERDKELVRRNRIRHPGFVPAGLPIQMLSE